MAMYNAREASLKAVENFPQWMDIRKRMDKCAGGQYLLSLMSEQDNLQAALKEYEDGFFLRHYFGHEDEVLCRVALAQIGKLDDFMIKDDQWTVTESPVTFIDHPDKYALYQSGYLLVSPDTLKENQKRITYQHNDTTYEADIELKDLWNIFDEFAMFSNLYRFDGETNLELEKRTLASFKNRTNGTQEGLKNAILNVLPDNVELEADEIQMEQPDGSNMYLELGDGSTVYDHLSSVNKDLAKEKVWNQSTWEHGFKKMSYLPNLWDKKLKGYQPGTGQRDDLKAILSSNAGSQETTDVEVLGYKASSILVNEYLRKQNIQRTIPLTLSRYRNELSDRTLEYKITATEAKKIDPNAVKINSYQHRTGTETFAIDDLEPASENISIVSKSVLKPDTFYSIEFYPRNEYESMDIKKCVLSSRDGHTQNLLKEQSGFKYVNGALHNQKTLFYADSLSDVLLPVNITDAESGGLTLGTNGTSGRFGIPLKVCAGQPMRIASSCEMTDYTSNRDFVKASGFTYDSDNDVYTASSAANASTLTVEMDCSQLQFEFVAAARGDEQGSISVQLSTDGTIDASKSGLKTSPATFSYSFGNLKHVKLVITKMGMNPVTIRGIKASRYAVKAKLSNGLEIPETNGAFNIPATVSDNDIAYIELKSYSTHTPIIQHVYIGASLAGSKYTVEKFNSGKDGSLVIETDCRAALYHYDANGAKVLDSDDYSTRNSYVNETTENQALYIDTSHFQNISSSSLRIYTGAYRGRVMSYLLLRPNDSVDKLTIVGTTDYLLESYPVSHYLGTTSADQVYIAGNTKGFAIKHANGSVELKPALKSQLNASADVYQLTGLPENTAGVFFNSEDSDSCLIASKTDADFYSCCILRTDAQEYIAYNSVKMLQSILDGVQMVNTFSPYLDMNRLMFYTISDVKVDGRENVAGASFIHSGTDKISYTNWSLGIPAAGLRCSYNADFRNMESYKLDVTNLNESFTLSNNIALKKVYSADAAEYELARYIITPPDTMRVTYSMETVQENLIVEEDGFNKLYFSNVHEILSVKSGNTEIPANEYSLLSEAGVIVWKHADTYKGQSVSVVYRYKNPVTLEFKDLSSLYELAGYSVDAYKLISETPVIYSGLHSGDSRNVLIGDEVPDKITASCTNSNFTPVISGNRVTVQRVADSPVVLVHPGYYYKDADEYYYYEHDHKTNVSAYDSIHMKNVDRSADTFRTITASSNHVRDSIMTNGGYEGTLCHIDFSDDRSRYDAGSDFNEITSCDSYQLWQDFNMNVSIVKGYNGLALNFKPEDKNAYAVMNITSFIKSGSLVSFSASQTIKASVFEEIDEDGESFSRSIYAEKTGDCTRKNGFLYYKFDALDKDHRYYLCITGEGTIDDIISRADASAENFAEAHHKNIDQLGFQIEEAAVKGYEARLHMTPLGCSYDGLEMDQDGLVETGSNVDWDLTQIHNFSEEFDKFIVDNADLQKEAFYTSDVEGSITSPWVPVENQENILMLFFKVNELLQGSFRVFNIKAYTADDSKGTNARLIGSERKTNLLAVAPNQLGSYLQIVIDMPVGRVINNIEIYARYAEGEQRALYVNQHDSGTMITKVFNTAAAGNYRPKYMTGAVTRPHDITVSVRGYRQDSGHGVWTQWYDCPFDENMVFSEDCHVFENYQYFQFRITIADMNADIRVDEFILEVV